MELYEFKPVSASADRPPQRGEDSSREPSWTRQSSWGFDQRYLFVSSFSLDGRSVALNTRLVSFRKPRYAQALSRDSTKTRFDRATEYCWTIAETCTGSRWRRASKLRFDKGTGGSTVCVSGTAVMSLLVPESQL